MLPFHTHKYCRWLYLSCRSNIHKFGLSNWACLKRPYTSTNARNEGSVLISSFTSYNTLYPSSNSTKRIQSSRTDIFLILGIIMVEVLLLFVCPTFSEVHQNEVRAILLLTLEPFQVNLLQTFNLPHGLMIASLLIGRSKTCPLSITWYQIEQMS